MSKHLHVIISDDTYKALSQMSHFRGELSYVVRSVLEKFVSDAKQMPSLETVSVKKAKP